MNEDQNPYSSPQAESFHDLPPAPSGSFDAVNQRFTRLLGEYGGPTLTLWIVISLLNLPSQLINVAAQEQMLNNIGLGFGMIGLVYVFSFVVGGISYGGFRVMRESEDRRGDVSVGEAFGLIFERFVPVVLTIILYGISVVIGAILCLIPGIIAALMFCVAPFIAACYGKGPVESMQMSFEWVKRHATIIAILIGAGIAYSIVLGGLMFVIMMVVGGGMAATGGTAASIGYPVTIATWFITSIGGYFMWVYVGSAFVTIGRAEELMGTVIAPGSMGAPMGPSGPAGPQNTPQNPDIDAYGDEW